MDNKNYAGLSAENEDIGAPGAHEKETLVNVKERLREISGNKKLLGLLNGIADRADESVVIKKIREYWDNMPRAVQWAVLHLPVPGVNHHSEILKVMVKLGLLEYKGADTEKDIRAMAKWEKLKIEWTVKIGKYFVPELKVAEKMLEPAMEIKDMQEEIMTDVRFHLKEKRQKKEDAAKIEQIKEDLLSGSGLKAAA